MINFYPPEHHNYQPNQYAPIAPTPISYNSKKKQTKKRLTYLIDFAIIITLVSTLYFYFGSVFLYLPTSKNDGGIGAAIHLVQLLVYAAPIIMAFTGIQILFTLLFTWLIKTNIISSILTSLLGSVSIFLIIRSILYNAKSFGEEVQYVQMLTPAAFFMLGYFVVILFTTYLCNRLRKALTS